MLADMGSPIPTDPGPNPIDGALRDDGFYDAVLNTYADWRHAGAFIARSLASQFAQDPDSVTVVGDISVSWKERVKTWLDQANRWDKEADAADVVPPSMITVELKRQRRRRDAEFRRPDWQDGYY